MDIGNLFKQLEEDSRVLLLSAIFCFPVAYLDCWKISSNFCTIDLIPQIIIALGIAVMLAIGGISFNLLYSAISSKAYIPLLTLLSILPAVVASIPVVIFGGTAISFEIIFGGLYIIGLACALLSRTRNKIKKKQNGE